MEIPASELQLSSICKSYGTMRAVDDVSMTIAAGEMVALLGPSGCGKSTTLRMIAGLVEQTAGEIMIGGRPVTHVPVHKRNIGMLFQNYALFPHLSVARNLAFGLEMRGIDKNEIGRRVDEALELVQLKPLAERPPAALSGGQQQRVALARALVIEPSILLLDEPLGALDKGLREAMQFELRQLQRRLGITTVMVTHDQDEAQTLADRIVVMNGGKIEQIGTPQEIYTRPATRFVAGFIGAGNFLTGDIVESNTSYSVVDIGSEERAKVLSKAPKNGTATILLRPEDINIIPADGVPVADVNCSRARVEQIIHRGSVAHVQLRRQDGNVLFSHCSNALASSLTPGGLVVATWSEESNWLIPGG